MSCDTEWAVRDIQPAALLDEVFVEQRADGIGAVDAADLLDVGPRCGLIIGNDRQGLQLRGRKPGRLARFQCAGHIGGHLARGAHLIGVLEAQDTDAAPLVGQAVNQRTHGLLGLVRVAFSGHGNAFELDRLARRKQDGLSYPFQLRLFHVLPFPPAFCKSGCSDRRRRPPA